MYSGIYKTYYGGKNGSGVYQQIINCIRPHDAYLELFAGNASIFRNKKPAQQNILNDLSKKVYNHWVAARIDNTVLFNCDAIDFLKTFSFEPQKRYCIYLDPPYPIHSRREKRERYECEMSDDQHRSLLNVVNNMPGNIDIIISTYENPIYTEGLKGWHLKTFKAQTRQYTATEFLYTNYNPNEGILYQYDFLGTDFTDRQRIKRKIEREVLRLKRLPLAERNAIIQAVADIT